MTHFPGNPRPSRRSALAFAAATTGLWALATPLSRAQSLPESARILVGFPPGGAPDLMARRLAEALTGQLARAVIVDNRPGAGGRIAVDIARQAPADLGALGQISGVGAKKLDAYGREILRVLGT